MRIGLYGMPSAGKSFILEKIDFIRVISGSRMLRELCPDFDKKDEENKKIARQQLADHLMAEDSFIMDGHYAFGDRIAFTESDGRLYDAFVYLYISPEVLRERMEGSEKNQKYLAYDIAEWQNREIEALRAFCHANDKDFYVVDNPPQNSFDDVSDVVYFLKDVIGGFSCVSMAERCAGDILSKSRSRKITLMDGDRTVTIEDTSNAVFGYTTQLYDGNFYTGYQSWKQAKEFESYSFEKLTRMPVSLNKNVCEKIDGDTYILTSGHERVWDFIAKELDVPCYFGTEMSAETKFFITKMLQRAGKRVLAYGDSMNDYYMLKLADRGFLVQRQDESFSRSLKGKDLRGLVIV